jgi:hypothetical protein
MNDQKLEDFFVDMIEEEYGVSHVCNITEFKPVEEDYKHHSCCQCCNSNTFHQVLIEVDNSYIIKRYGTIYTPQVSCYLSHDMFKDGEHPVFNYKKIIKGDIEHQYNKYLIEKDIIINPNFFGCKAEHWQKNKEYTKTTLK